MTLVHFFGLDLLLVTSYTQFLEDLTAYHCNNGPHMKVYTDYETNKEITICLMQVLYIEEYIEATPEEG